MAETQPMMLQELCYTAADFRLQMNSIVCGEGVADLLDGSLLVTTGGAGLDLSVAEGAAFIDSDSADQGIYSVYNDAPVTVTATTADGTNPRIDQVIATVNDSQISGTDDDWVLSVLAGTPTVGATLSNLNGAAALPDRSIRLAYVLVPASFAGPFVNATHILGARTPFVSCGEPEIPSTQWGRATNQAFTANNVATVTYPVAATGTTVPNSFYSEAAGVVTFAKPGLYLVDGYGTWAANSDATERLLQLTNGAASVVHSSTVGPALNSPSFATSQVVSAVVNVVAAGETLILRGRAAANINMTAAALRVTRIGSLA